MGFFFGLITGGMVGVYVAQNYQIIDVREAISNLCQQMKQYEKKETKDEKK
jgi:hypothetical protein